jgi:hypothetical protein
MHTQKRIETYTRQNRGARLTHRQRRRIAKRAGSDPCALVVRDEGMGYSPAMQGYREVTECWRPAPVDLPSI